MSQQNRPNPKPSREEAELDEAYYGLTGRRPSIKIDRTSAIIIGICSVVTVLAIIVVIFALCYKKPFEYQHVTMSGMYFHGKSEDEARKMLEQAAENYNTPMTVTVMDEIIVITPKESNVKLDIEKALAGAKEASGTGADLDILPYLGIDEAALWKQLLPLEEKYGVTPSKTTWQITGEDPAADNPEDPGSKKLTITMGVPDYGLDMEKLYQMILQGYRMQNFNIRMNCEMVEPEKPDLDQIHAATSTEATDATLDETTFEIVPESFGYGFDLEDAKLKLSQCGHGEVLEIPFVKSNPLVTAEQLDKELYGDVLGEYKTPHTADKDRNENLRLACQAIDGLIILPGQTFSYNEALGERTEEKGYKPAASYVNGLTVDTVGGGICQVSSTLYYVCLLSDMEIVVRSPHGYVSSYIPKGMDAAVSWKYQDFKFKNPLSTPIRIEAWVDGGYVFVRIHGKETRDYYVEMVYKELSSEPYDTVYKEYAPDNAEGYTNGQIIITPYTGCSVKTYKRLIDRETGKLIKRVYETQTTYQKRDKVICLIVEPTPPEVTPEPVPPETSSPENSTQTPPAA